MSQNLKNNLFRFVTLRQPQAVNDEQKSLGFVQYPEEATSAFYPNPESEAAQGYEPYLSKTEVINLNKPLYNFSLWLMKHKNALIFDTVTRESDGIALLGDYELPVWDNLFYQTLNKASNSIREALIQMLIADKFIKYFRTYSRIPDESIIEEVNNKLIRCANASVVIPKEVLVKKESTPKEVKGLSATEEKRLVKLLQAKYDQEVLKKLESELKNAQKEYLAQDKQAYNAALNAYQQSVDTIMDAAQIELVNKWDVTDQAYKQVERLVHDPLPEFNYVSLVEINEELLNSKISPLGFQFMQSQGLFDLDTYDAVLSVVKQDIKTSGDAIKQLEPKSSKTVQKGGAQVSVKDPFNTVLELIDDVDAQITELVNNNMSSSNLSNLVPKSIEATPVDGDVCYSARLIANSEPGNALSDNDWSFLMGFKYYDEQVIVTGVDVSVTFTNDSAVIQSSSYNIYGSNGNNSRMNLFTDIPKITKATNAGNPILSGTITLSNGTTLSFSEITIDTTSSSVSSFNKHGSEEITFNCEGTIDGGGSTSETTEAAVFGITNLGIADFRRVEQELCCYVPGEVSHIENVMAREFKERSTTSRITSEDITERVDELERENLTDTTTTERNEMQSEVASVINEDSSQNYGANASVNGSFPGGASYSASAYFNGSTASSTSNSNVQAQTYAQEVTERAMERIVQKTQTKRTSRILKEFVENNTHGFDNRKGASHVSGVYRWVDKIYKNKLINYGKRLMYEFAIPEPARFLKDAIWKDIDETGQAGSAVIIPEPPKHPKTYGLISASSLKDSNYQDFAARYNAEVKAKPADRIFVGKSFSSSIQISDSREFTETMSDHEDYKLPEGYETLEAKVQFKVPHEGNLQGSVVVGTTKFLYSYYASSPNSRSLPVDRFTGTIPISFSSVGFHAGNIGVSIECKLTDEGIEQWQNDTYNAIMGAYYERLREYNEAAQNEEVIRTGDKVKLTFNPGENRSLEKKELKRIALQLLTAPFDIKTDKNNYVGSHLIDIDRTADFQKHAETVKFFEQAFDWDIMSYIFYPYMYGDKKDWKSLLQQKEAADPIFQAFLQSGMARTIVPVRPGFEDAVNWYMETGEIWDGQGMVADQADDTFVSIAEEMQTVEGEVEDAWETRLPTSLTIIQAGTIGLNVEGLPCNSDCEESNGNPIEQTNSQIGEEGVGADVVESSNTVR